MPPPKNPEVPQPNASASASNPVAAIQAPIEPVRPNPTTPAASPFPKDISVTLYSKIGGASGNFMFSTPSLTQALGIAYVGAKGDTAKEMAGTLGFDADPKKAAADTKSDLAAWKTAAGSAELAIANRLWLEKTFPLKADYTKSVNDSWGAGVENIDFVNGSEASRKTINGWVGKQTKDKIPELFAAGTFTPLTRLVITNAIYFKGNWSFPFDKSETKSDTFKVDGKTDIRVPLMHKTQEFNASTIDGGKILELPYSKSDLAMDIFLPDAADGLPTLEASMSPQAITKWTASLHSQRVVVTLPKFTFSSGGTLDATLSTLGMKTAFTDAADFSGITSAATGLQISTVVQKTFIAVDETGTEAAASTGVVMATRGMAARPFEFKADHPFAFAIRDTKTGRILFMGRVSNPKP